MSPSWLSAWCIAFRTHSNRCSVRIAANTSIQPRTLQAAMKVSRNRWPSSWVSKRQREVEAWSDKPGLRSCCHFMQRRLALVVVMQHWLLHQRSLHDTRALILTASRHVGFAPVM
jgi:hypothetical protein